ncbi:hypothetical protein E0E62_21170 [Streptomyces sp. 16-176A]
MWSAGCGVRGAGCGVRSAECGVRSAGCGVRVQVGRVLCGLFRSSGPRTGRPPGLPVDEVMGRRAPQAHTGPPGQQVVPEGLTVLLTGSLIRGVNLTAG